MSIKNRMKLIPYEAAIGLHQPFEKMGYYRFATIENMKNGHRRREFLL